MTQLTLLYWPHLNPIEKDMIKENVSHIPAFPWLDGNVLYYPFSNGYERVKLAHTIDGEIDVFIKNKTIKTSKQMISTVSFPSSHWSIGTFEQSLLTEDECTLFKSSLQDQIGKDALQAITQCIKNDTTHMADDRHSVIQFYNEKVETIETYLPIPLKNRYYMTCAEKEVLLSKQAHDDALYVLFGRLTYYLLTDLHALGYTLTSIDFTKNYVEIELTEEREQFTVQWAKDYTNAILLTQQKYGYEKAMTHALRFDQFCHKYNFIGTIPSLGGNLNNLATTLKASCELGLIKEGITMKKWQPKKILERWRDVITRIPLTMNDSILIGSPMETLYSFTVNTVAWVETMGAYDESSEITFSYVHYYEERLKHNKIDEELSTTLAVSFYHYLKKTNQLREAQFPHVAKAAKRKRIPYKKLTQVYKPPHQLTKNIKGFYHFISRGHAHRIMGTSIFLSLLLIIVLFLIQ